MEMQWLLRLSIWIKVASTPNEIIVHSLPWVAESPEPEEWEVAAVVAAAVERQDSFTSKSRLVAQASFAVNAVGVLMATNVSANFSTIEFKSILFKDEG